MAVHKSTSSIPELNDQQADAANHKSGPMLVVAGAGTGKTRVIVERISRLIQDGVAPKNILALTFTEKAAAEMLDRTNELLGTYQVEMPILTFNAFGESLLRRYAADIGLSRGFILMGDNAQIVFLRERIDDLKLDYFSPISNPDGLLGDIADYFSLLKQNVVTPQQYQDYVANMPASNAAEQLEKSKHAELANAFATYLRLCRETNVIDYDDQLYLLIDLLSQRPNVLKEVQQTFTYVMVDEFQDTNVMQSVLIDMIVGDQQNIFVVGDDDQSIYGWRGATLANILDFKKRYPATEDVTLVQNYRSTSEILDSAYKLIQHNNPQRLEIQLHINKQLTSEKKGKKPSLCSFENLDEELQWIAEDIKKRISVGEQPGSIAVLARRNTTVQLLESYLHYAEIPYSVTGQRYDLYREPVVRTIVEAIRAVSDPTDNLSLYHTLIGPLFSIAVDSVSQLSRQARQQHENLLQIIEAGNLDEELAEAIGMIKTWQSRAATSSVGQLAYDILEESGYKKRLFENSSKDPAVAVSAMRLAELFRSFKEFEMVALQPTAIQYVQALPALMASVGTGEDGTLDLSGEAVNVLTIHRSKGLEWKTVYVVDCTEGSFPLRESSRGLMLPQGLVSNQASEADSHIAEERRLMYVAMTRAQQNLILTKSERHNSASLRKPSRFLQEAFDESYDTKQKPLQTGLIAHSTAFDTQQIAHVALPASILDGNTLHLSVSQIQTYLDCPLNFYYCYVLHIPEEPSAIMEYGSLMHRLVEDMNRGLMKGQLPSHAQLEERLLAEWPRIGYMSKGHRERALEQGKQTLQNLYKRFTDDPAIPIAIEESFTCMVPDYNLVINGRFDAVIPMQGGVEIVDYKTGTSVTTPEKAKQRATASQQLTYYALAWQLLHDEIPRQVTLDFIDTGQRGSVKKTQRGIDGSYTRLRQVADGLRAHDFTPSKDHTYCKHPPL